MSEPKAEKCLAPTFVRDGEGDRGSTATASCALGTDAPVERATTVSTVSVLPPGAPPPGLR